MNKYVTWLGHLAGNAIKVSQRGRPFGLFGTSIAATWLATQMGDRIDFFVEEDESRVGKQHLGRPIVRPDDAPASSTVFLALAPRTASMIAGRLADRLFKMIEPPPLIP